MLSTLLVYNIYSSENVHSSIEYLAEVLNLALLKGNGVFLIEPHIADNTC